jgi:hypothetical protein
VKVLKMSVGACFFAQEMVCLELEAPFLLLWEQLQVSKASQPQALSMDQDRTASDSISPLCGVWSMHLHLIQHTLSFKVQLRCFLRAYDTLKRVSVSRLQL